MGSNIQSSIGAQRMFSYYHKVLPRTLCYKIPGPSDNVHNQLSTFANKGFKEII